MIYFFVLLACKATDAPEDFDALNSYLYENFDEPDRYVEDGLRNLIAWLPDNEPALKDGYRVSNLSAAAIESTGQKIPEQLYGIALGVDYNHSVESIAWASFTIEPEDLNPESDGYNLRTYLTDVSCFLEQECATLSYSGEVQSFLPLGIEVISNIFSEVRWVETEWGMAYIQRRWLTSEPNISVDWAHVNGEYGFIMTIPRPNREHALRIEATWIDMSIDGIPIPEDLAVQLSLGALRDSINVTDNYLDNNPP